MSLSRCFRITTFCAMLYACLVCAQPMDAQKSMLSEHPELSMEREEPWPEERLWSKLKDIPIGLFSLDIGAGLRLRGEWQDNFNVKKYGDDSRDEFLLERARLELSLRFLEGFRVFVQGQDAHEFGCNFSNEDFQGGSPYNNHFDLRQAFLEWTKIGKSPFGFKLGRQSLSYSDNRLMGPGEWGNVGRYTWDAAMLTWRSNLANVDLFYAFRVQHDPTSFDRHHFDYDVLGLFATFPLPVFKLQAFYFLQMNNFPSEDSVPVAGFYHRHSPGVSVEGVFNNGLDMGLGLIPQFGKWGEKTVSAFGGYAVFGYTAPLYGSPRIGLHYAYGSGDSNPEEDRARTFDGIFGAVDNYYGRMNLFSWMNLHDLQVAFSGNPWKVVKISIDYHLFLLADKHDAWYFVNGKPQRQDASGSSGYLLGHEFDLVITVKATKYARLQCGYGLFVPGKFVTNTGPNTVAHWGFLEGNYEF